MKQRKHQFNHSKLAGVIAESGKKQNEISNALGIHYNTVSAWVNGRRYLEPDRLYRVLRLVGWSNEQISGLRMIDFYPVE